MTEKNPLALAMGSIKFHTQDAFIIFVDKGNAVTKYTQKKLGYQMALENRNNKEEILMSPFGYLDTDLHQVNSRYYRYHYGLNIKNTSSDLYELIKNDLEYFNFNGIISVQNAISFRKYLFILTQMVVSSIIKMI